MGATRQAPVLEVFVMDLGSERSTDVGATITTDFGGGLLAPSGDALLVYRWD